MSALMVFDDRPITKAWVDECVEGTSIKTYYCHTINTANTIWDKHGNDISLLVLDIMMPARGLPDWLREKTQDNYLTGWVWVWNNKTFENPAHGKKIILYSGYLPILESHMNSTDVSPVERRLYDEIIRLKKGLLQSAMELKKHILQLAGGDTNE